jgi:hypothetical protein
MGSFRQLRQHLALRDPDHEEPWPKLGDAVICSIQDGPPALVPSVFDLSEEPLERYLAGLVAVREGVDVLKDEGPGPGLGQHSRVRLQEAGIWVKASALPLKPEPGL